MVSGEVDDDLNPLIEVTVFGKGLRKRTLTAILDNNTVAVNALLGARADINKPYRGKTALHVAVAKAHSGAVAALLAAGANHLLPDKSGATPLDIARKRRRKAVLSLLEAAETARLAGIA